MKRFKAFFFLLTFCFSTLGYSLELHYCKGQITDISFIGHAECLCGADHSYDHQNKLSGCTKTCHGELPVDHGKLELKGKGCCKTEHLTFYSSSLKALSTYHIPSFDLLYPEVFASFDTHVVYKASARTALDYSIPLLHRDITVLTRTFRI